MIIVVSKSLRVYFRSITSIRNGENKVLNSAAIVVLFSKAHLQDNRWKKIEDTSVIFKHRATFGQFPQSDSDRVSNSIVFTL